MDIEKAKEIVQGLKVYYDNYSLLDEEEKEENELVNNSIDLILAELDKDNNIISDLQNEVTLKQCELDKKDKIINDAKQWIENTMNDSHIVGCNLGDLQMLLDILESED